MQILMNTGGIAVTNCFVIADETAKVAVLFDAPDHTTAELLDEVARRGWRLIGLWLTHGHFDHIADHQVVTDRFPDAKVLIHALDEMKLKQPKSAMFDLPFTIPARSADQLIENGHKLMIGSLQADVLHTPGHSPGHVMFHFQEQKVLVGGDLIIGGSVGRTDLPDSNPVQLCASIRQIMSLPDETQLLPGHGQPATLGYERQTNQYVQMVLEGDLS
jgi:glyoxylase-like metal-dependent hydrolase (beta-lactamase superfamily II)